jgi:hypothetical protein
MRTGAIVWSLLLLACACGGSGGGASDGSKGGSVNLTLSGSITGTSQHLDKADCPTADAAGTSHIFVMNLYPIVNGKRFHFALAINPWTTPVSLTLPQNPAMATPVIVTIQQEGGDELYSNDSRSAGTISQRDLRSGSVDLHQLRMTGTDKAVDLKLTYRCPS